jgi:hypothetical protein
MSLCLLPLRSPGRGGKFLIMVQLGFGEGRSKTRVVNEPDGYKAGVLSREATKDPGFRMKERFLTRVETPDSDQSDLPGMFPHERAFTVRKKSQAPSKGGR